MYVARIKRIKYVTGYVFLNPDDVVYVLDTDDGIVERYKYPDCIELFKGIDVKGFLTKEKTAIYSYTFEELLCRRLVLKNWKCTLDNEFLFNVLTWRNGGITCEGSYTRLMFNIELQHRIDTLSVKFLWAEKLGVKGYRFIVEFAIDFEKLATPGCIFVHFFLDNDNNIYVYNIEMEKWLDAGVEIKEEFKPPRSIYSKVSMLDIV